MSFCKNNGFSEDTISIILCFMCFMWPILGNGATLMSYLDQPGRRAKKAGGRCICLMVKAMHGRQKSSV